MQLQMTEKKKIVKNISGTISQIKKREGEELVLEMALGMKRMWWSQQNLMLQLSLGSDGALDSTVTLNILKPCNLEENGQTRNTGGVSCMRIIITG